MKAITKDMAVAELAGIVAEHLRSRGIDVVLSGGALVGIYSHGEYMSEDIDFVTFASNKEIAPALAELGFRKGPGRHFIHPGTNLILEFPRGPLSVGEELVTVVDLETLGGRISVLSQPMPSRIDLPRPSTGRMRPPFHKRGRLPAGTKWISMSSYLGPRQNGPRQKSWPVSSRC